MQSDRAAPRAVRWIRWAPIAAYAAFIFALSSIPDPPVVGPMPLNDKVKHFVLYFGFGWLIARGLRPAFPGRPWRLVAVAAIIASAYAVSDEYHQSFVPGRMADWGDWLADTLGGLASAAGFTAWRRA